MSESCLSGGEQTRGDPRWSVCKWIPRLGKLRVRRALSRRPRLQSACYQCARWCSSVWSRSMHEGYRGIRRRLRSSNVVESHLHWRVCRHRESLRFERDHNIACVEYGVILRSQDTDGGVLGPRRCPLVLWWMSCITRLGYPCYASLVQVYRLELCPWESIPVLLDLPSRTRGLGQEKHLRNETKRR